MAKSIEATFRTYVAAWGEPDPVARGKLLEECWAVDGRLITAGDGFRGREALSTLMARIVSDPRKLTVHITSAIDVQGRMFRVRGIVKAADGTIVGENYDAGEVDAEGRIAFILTFNGPLPER